MAGVDLFEILGPPSDEVARKLIVLFGLTPEQPPRTQAADEQNADAA